MSCISEDKLKL